MLSFRETRDILQKRYNLNICEASENAKSILEDAKIPFMGIKIDNELELHNYLNNLENLGNK